MGPQVLDDSLYYHCILFLVRRPSLSGIHVFLVRIAAIGVSFKVGVLLSPTIKSGNRSFMFYAVFLQAPVFVECSSKATHLALVSFDFSVQASCLGKRYRPLRPYDWRLAEDSVGAKHQLLSQN